MNKQTHYRIKLTVDTEGVEDKAELYRRVEESVRPQMEEQEAPEIIIKCAVAEFFMETMEKMRNRKRLEDEGELLRGLLMLGALSEEADGSGEIVIDLSKVTTH